MTQISAGHAQIAMHSEAHHSSNGQPSRRDISACTQVMPNVHQRVSALACSLP